MPNDTLGPTLKMKRGNVYKLYANEIEAAYQANAAKSGNVLGKRVKRQVSLLSKGRKPKK